MEVLDSGKLAAERALRSERDTVGALREQLTARQQRADEAACKGQELQELVKYNADLAAKVDDAEKHLHVRQAQWMTDQKATQQALHVARQQVAIASSYKFAR